MKSTCVKKATATNNKLKVVSQLNLPPPLSHDSPRNSSRVAAAPASRVLSRLKPDDLNETVGTSGSLLNGAAVGDSSISLGSDSQSGLDDESSLLDFEAFLHSYLVPSSPAAANETSSLVHSNEKVLAFGLDFQSVSDPPGPGKARDGVALRVDTHPSSLGRYSPSDVIRDVIFNDDNPGKQMHGASHFGILPGSTILFVTESTTLNCFSSTDNEAVVDAADSIAKRIPKEGIFGENRVTVRRGNMLVTVDAVTGTISDRRLCTLWPEDASCPRWTAWESGSLRLDVGARKTKLYVFGQGIRHASVTSGVNEIRFPREEPALSPIGRGYVYVQIGGPEAEVREVLVVHTRALVKELGLLYKQCARATAVDNKYRNLASFCVMERTFAWMMVVAMRRDALTIDEQASFSDYIAKARRSLNLAQLPEVSDFLNDMEDVLFLEHDENTEQDVQHEKDLDDTLSHPSPTLGYVYFLSALVCVFRSEWFKLDPLVIFICHIPAIFIGIWLTFFLRQKGDRATYRNFIMCLLPNVGYASLLPLSVSALAEANGRSVTFSPALNFSLDIKPTIFLFGIVSLQVVGCFFSSTAFNAVLVTSLNFSIYNLIYYIVSGGSWLTFSPELFPYRPFDSVMAMLILPMLLVCWIQSEKRAFEGIVLKFESYVEKLTTHFTRCGVPKMMLNVLRKTRAQYEDGHNEISPSRNESEKLCQSTFIDFNALNKYESEERQVFVHRFFAALHAFSIAFTTVNSEKMLGQSQHRVLLNQTCTTVIVVVQLFSTMLVPALQRRFFSTMVTHYPNALTFMNSLLVLILTTQNTVIITEIPSQHMTSIRSKWVIYSVFELNNLCGAAFMNLQWIMRNGANADLLAIGVQSLSHKLLAVSVFMLKNKDMTHMIKHFYRTIPEFILWAWILPALGAVAFIRVHIQGLMITYDKRRASSRYPSVGKKGIKTA